MMSLKKYPLILVATLLLLFSPTINAKEINELTIQEKIKSEKFIAHAIPLADDDVIDVPQYYNTAIVVNPETGQKFLKIPPRYSERGVKKVAIVNAFKHGGKHLAVVMDVVSPATAKYIQQNSLKIANTINNASAMIHGEIYQALLAAGVPTTTARNIAWAIDAFLL